MGQITFQGSPVTTIGELPTIGMQAPPFTLTQTDLSEVTLENFHGKKVILNIFPSIDTPVCAASVRRFNAEATQFENTVVLCVSADLPFAHQRFCMGEGLESVSPLSVFRQPTFGKDYGVTITNGPLQGLLSRAIVVIDENAIVIHVEQVSEISEEPNYAKVIDSLTR